MLLSMLYDGVCMSKILRRASADETFSSDFVQDSFAIHVS